MQRLFFQNDFSKGIVTQTDSGDAPENSGVRVENIRIDKPGLLRGERGYKLFANGPAGIAADDRHFQEVVINDTQVFIAWGQDGNSIQHFYYSSNGGTTWIEITEIVFCEVATVTSSTVFTISAGSAPFDDAPSSLEAYYQSPNFWWIFWHDVSTPANDAFDLVKTYVGSTKTVTVKYGFSGIANGDKVILMRFPLWNFADLQDLADGTIANFDKHRNFVRDAGNFKPTIVQRQDAVAIYCGRKKDNVNGGIPNHTGIWFGFIRIASMFADSDTFNGYIIGAYHAERLFLDGINTTNLIASLASPATSTVGLAAGDYGVVLTLIYDEFQESPVFLKPGDTLAAGQVHTVASNDDLQINLSWDKLTTNTEMQNHPGSLRMDALRVYLCKVDAARKPTTPFFMVKEVKIKGKFTLSGFWTLATIPYVQTVTITGADWDAGTQFESELVHGYFSRIRVNADLATVVDGREIVASLTTGEQEINLFEVIGAEESKHYLIYPAINSANRVTPDAHPEADIKDMSEHGIYAINNIQPLRNKLAVFGENDVVLLAGTEEVDKFEKRGVNWWWSVVSKGEKLFWGNIDSIYDLREGGEPREMGFAIRDTWQALSEDNRKKSIAVHDSKNDLFLLHSPSGTTYIWDDQREAWRTYISDKTWEWLSVGVDGEILATDKTNIYQLFPDSGSTENLIGVYEKVIDFGGPVSVKQIKLMYKITGTITVKIFDLEKSESYHIAEAKFFSQSQFLELPKKMSFNAKKIKLQMTISPTAASNHNYEIDWVALYGHPLTEHD